LDQVLPLDDSEYLGPRPSLEGLVRPSPLVEGIGPASWAKDQKLAAKAIVNSRLLKLRT